MDYAMRKRQQHNRFTQPHGKEVDGGEQADSALHVWESDSMQWKIRHLYANMSVIQAPLRSRVCT
jgi:hypothetical protein